MLPHSSSPNTSCPVRLFIGPQSVSPLQRTPVHGSRKEKGVEMVEGCFLAEKRSYNCRRCLWIKTVWLKSNQTQSDWRCLYRSNDAIGNFLFSLCRLNLLLHKFGTHHKRLVTVSKCCWHSHSYSCRINVISMMFLDISDPSHWKQPLILWKPIKCRVINTGSLIEFSILSLPWVAGPQLIEMSVPDVSQALDLCWFLFCQQIHWMSKSVSGCPTATACKTGAKILPKDWRGFLSMTMFVHDFMLLSTWLTQVVSWRRSSRRHK